MALGSIANLHYAMGIGTAESHTGTSQVATLVTLPSPSLSSPHTSAVTGSRQFGPHREGKPGIAHIVLIKTEH